MAKQFEIPTSYGPIEVTLAKRGGRTAGAVTLPRHYSLGDEEDFPALGIIVSMILGHACAGVNVCSKGYVAGIEAAFAAVGNQE